MTKASLARLIELSVDYWVQRYQQAGVIQFAEREELAALSTEFENWEPEPVKNTDPLAGLRFADPAIPRCPNCGYLSWTCRRCGHVEMASE